ncbi:MAG: ATP-binding protein, partial [Pseudobdellovibrionaceae bacterium]|nr:ATP-binding protein [Pseudobdellovibrionaceae bacterium]
LMLGPNRTIYREYQLDLVRDLITVGAIFIMAFYHFYLWGIRKSRYAPLYFGLYCLAVSIRTLTAGEGEILTLVFPDTPLELQFKTEYAGMTVGFFALTVLTSELYPKEFSKYMSYVVAVICALWLVMILATPATIYPLFLRFMQMVIAIVGTTQFVSLGLACVRKREGARIFMVGFSMFFLAGLFDILTANNVIQMMPLAHLGTFCIVFTQAIILSKRFDQAFDRVEHAERELRQLNEVLEHKVEERTDQINTILNNVSSGFLLIDRQGRILPGFTESCHGLLGAKLQAGQILPELIQLGDAVRRSFRVAVAQVFEDNMPTEVSLSQIPTRVKLGAKTLGLSCVALRNHEQKIHAVLFTIHDATDLQEAEYQVHINTMLLNIIQEKESFKFFLHDYREDLKAILVETEKDNQPALRTFLHTLKGNLAAFAIHDLVGHIHQIESLPRIEKSNIMAIADHFERLLNDHEKVLRLGTFDSQIVEVNRDDFLAVESYAPHRIKEPDRQNIINLCHKSRLMTIHSYIGPLENGAVNLAQRLGKNIRCEIEGQSLRVDEQYSPVLRNLVHIIRNAVDHGIELPEDRGDKGPEGVIRLQFAFDSAAFCIAVEDDGAGLNLEKIREKAQKLGVASAHDRMSDEDLTRYILLQGFSTADSTSLISGRGVGMAAVHEAVQKLQGTLSIKNRVGHGVRFEIKLPLLGTHALGVQDSLRTLQIV